jgi:transmembrane sensor
VEELNLLAEWRPEHSLEPNPDLLAIPTSATIVKWIAVISTLAAVFAVGLLIKTPWSRTTHNETMLLTSSEGALFYEYHVLEDGSIIELNRGAQVSVNFSEEKRLINLMTGEAHFTVAKNVNRPFIVYARNTAVEAVGTAFNVSLNSEEIEVLVTEGRVMMTAKLPDEDETSDENDASTQRELVAGQRSYLSLQTPSPILLVEDFSIEQIDKRLSWKNEVLEFTATPLSEVILEFNRRNHTQLVINDPLLRNRAITATLRPNNLDGFLQLIELTLNVRIERAEESKIILHSGE